MGTGVEARRFVFREKYDADVGDCVALTLGLGGKPKALFVDGRLYEEEGTGDITSGTIAVGLRLRVADHGAENPMLDLLTGFELSRTVANVSEIMLHSGKIPRT